MKMLLVNALTIKVVLSIIVITLTQNILIKSSLKNDIKPTAVTRDGTLTKLANLLNDHQVFFQNWNGTEKVYVEFIGVLKPWILSQPSFPLHPVLPFKFHPPVVKLNCRQNKYAGVLTGVELKVPRLIVDFVPFGYDIDKLELRLYEAYDIVDAFVIYESPKTLSSLSKQLYFPEIKKDPRFLKFLDKIVYVRSHLSDIQSDVIRARKGILNGGSPKSGGFALDNSMRIKMVEGFKKLNSSVPLKHFIMQNIETAFGIQNDADEIINRDTLTHLKHCEVQKEVKSIYVPCISFKKNYHWLLRSFDITGLTGFDINNTTGEILNYLWKPAPYLWPLKVILTQTSTFRSHSIYKNLTHHMGLGGAGYISSVAEPSEYWLKRGGVNEQSFRNALPLAIINAGKIGKITPQLINEHTIQPWCTTKHYSIHVSNFNFNIQLIINSSIPWLARRLPGRYPFLLPGWIHSKDNAIVGLMKRTGDPEWIKLCELGNATSF
jgi:hypothetical protein